MFCLLALAAAAALDEAAVQQAVDQLAPRVEEVAHRKFARIPRVEVDTRNSLLGDFEKHAKAALDAGTPESVVAEERRQAQKMVASALAIYSHADAGIHLLIDNVDRYVRNTGVNAGMLRESSLRCVLAHELTHALQAQHVPERFGGADDEEGVGLALIEGHATHVEHRLCENPFVWGFLQASLGIDVLSSRGPDDEVPFLYGYGEVYVRALEEHGGPDAIWSALGRAPPSKAALVGVVAPYLVPGWQDPALVADALAPAVQAGWTLEARPASAYEVLPEPEGRLDRSNLAPPVRAGLYARATEPGGEGRLAVAALVFEDEEHPRKWIETRRRTAVFFLAGRMTLKLFFEPDDTYDASVLDLPGLQHAWGLDGTTCIKVGTETQYLECWAARGRLLLLTAQRQAKVRTADARRAMETVLARKPETEFPTPTLGPEALAVLGIEAPAATTGAGAPASAGDPAAPAP